MTLGLGGQPLLAANAVSYPCACGELIWCIGDHHGIQTGVAAHNATLPHREWRQREVAAGRLLTDDEFWSNPPLPKAARR